MKNVEDLYVLSSLQKRMLVHALAAPPSDRFSEQLTCTFQGDLDVAAMKQAWERVIQRHPALRTAFVWEGLKKPLQVVRRHVRLPWEQHDLRPLDPEAAEIRRAELLRENRTRPFPLDQAPLMRLLLIERTEKTFDFAWTCHHLVTDGWCLGPVLTEVLACYEAYRRGHPPTLDPAPPFRDYIAWLQQQDQAATQRFWRHYLEGYQTPVQLPIQKTTRGALAPAASFGQIEAALPAQSTRQLTRLAASKHLSLSTVLEGAWALLLARYGGLDDVVYGVTVSGRPPELPGVESIVGPMINNLPARAQMDPTEPLLPWLARLHAARIELQAHAHCPLEDIQHASPLPPGCRLFETLVVVENYPLDPKRLAQTTSLRLLTTDGTATATYPLTLVATPGQQLTLRLQYDPRRCDPEDSSRLTDHLATLLEEIATGPERSLADLPLEKGPAWAPFHPGLLVHRFNGGDAPRPGQPAATTKVADTCRVSPPEPTASHPALAQMAAILDHWGRPAPVGVPGELILWQRDAMERPGESAAVIDDPPSGIDPGGKPPLIRTGVRARRLSDGRLEYLGQAADPLRVGMYRVNPDRLRDRLRENPLVDDAAVVGWHDPTGAQRLAAYVVPARRAATVLDGKERALVIDRLRRWLGQHLPEPLVPTALLAVDSLPYTPEGDLDTAALPPPTQPRPEALGPAVAPRDPIEAQLASLWSELLGVYPVGVTDRFMDLGGDSTQAVSLIARMEDRFQRKIPVVALFHEPTVEYLASLLRRPAEAAGEQTLVPIRPRGGRPPLFCVHPAGGTLFCYLELARYLPDDQPVWGLQARGIDGRLAPHTSVDAMAEHYVRAIREQQPAGPYRLAGWSSGGIIAFEVARQLETQGHPVDVLALFDAAVPDPHQPLDGSDLVPLLAMIFPGESEETLRDLEKAGPEEQLAYFQQRAEMAQLVVAGAAAGQAQSVYQVFQANMEAITQYRPRPCQVPITLFRAEQPSTPMHHDPWLGWRPWTRGPIHVHQVSGNHLTMFRPPRIAQIASLLLQTLDAADGALTRNRA